MNRQDIGLYKALDAPANYSPSRSGVIMQDEVEIYPPLPIQKWQNKTYT